MAGMLPGVELARRRRFRQAGSSIDSLTGSRRSAYWFYSRSCNSMSHTESNLSTNIMERRSYSYSSKRLISGDVVREARERLDEKLKSQRSSWFKSSGCGGRGDADGKQELPGTVLGNAQREIYYTKRKSLSKSKWSWMRRRKNLEEEEEECVICIEEFRSGDLVLNLPCAHRFHWNCVVPWLVPKSHCPCCRTSIFS